MKKLHNGVNCVMRLYIKYIYIRDSSNR